MNKKEQIIEILNKYTTMYLGGMSVITDEDFDELASEISDLQFFVLYIVTSSNFTAQPYKKTLKIQLVIYK